MVAHLIENPRAADVTTVSKPQPLNERVYEEIRRSLMSGAFQPGETLTLRNLAQWLGTSSMPVRDAINRLVAERALLMKPHSRTAVVPSLTPDKFAEIIRVRSVIEGMAAEAATANVSDDEINELTHLQAEMVRLSPTDIRSYLRHNYNFHFLIYRASHSTVLLPIIESLWLQTGPILNQVGMNAPPTSGSDQDMHEFVIRGLKSRNGALVRTAMSSDIETGGAEILRRMGRAQSKVRAVSA